MRKALMIFMCLSAVCFSAAAYTQTNVGTKFRGLAINMTKSEFDALRISEFDVKQEEGKIELAKKGSVRTCAILYLDQDNKITKLELNRCFFGASDLDLTQFAEAIIKSYHVGNLSSESKNIELGSHNGVPYGANYQAITGFMATGEKIVISEMFGAISATITRSNAPKFNSPIY